MPPHSDNSTTLQQLTLENKIDNTLKITPRGLFVPKNLQVKYNCNETDWEDFLSSLEEKESGEALKDLQNILELRKQNEWKLPENLLPEDVPFIKEEIRSLELIRSNQSKFLGKGASGGVFMTDMRNTVCTKYLYDPSKAQKSISEEFELHTIAFDILSRDVNSVIKIPTPLHIIKNIDITKSFYDMDTVPGLSFQQILECQKDIQKLLENAGIDAISTINKLKSKDFIKKLHICLKVIHDSGVVHNDIHSGNLMLGKNGNLYLIDFGNSINLFNTDKTEEMIANEKQRDFDWIEKEIKRLVLFLENLTN